MADNFRKFITGIASKVDTTGGQSPVAMSVGMPGGNLEAPMSSCTITAPAAITYNGQAYAAGEVLFYTDGYNIFDSTFNQMLGNDITTSNGRTGGVRAAPQAVSIIPVNDTLAGQVTGGKVKALFWCFFNGMYDGISVGVIDMTGNSGRGEFKNHLNIGQALGPLTGILKDSTCDGRMVTGCYNANGNIEVPFLIIKNYFISAGVDNNKFSVYRFTTIDTTTGAPNIYGGTTTTGNPVVTEIGPTTNKNDGAMQGTLSITESDLNPASSNYNLFKVGTIIQNFAGSSVAASLDANLFVMNLDASTGILSDGSSMGMAAMVNQQDLGPLSWPSSGVASRYYSMHTCWSHTSTKAAGTIYFGEFKSGIAADNIVMTYQDFDDSNVYGLTGDTILQTPNGDPFWVGTNGPSRIIGGIWRDPQLSGRIFYSAPEQIDKFTLSVGDGYYAWSTQYPEIWGDFSLPTYNIGVIDGANTAPTATYSWEGTPEPDTMVGYGAPAFHYCSLTSPVVESIHIAKCTRAGNYTVDENNNLWKTEIGVTASMNLVLNLTGVTNFKSIDFNQYTSFGFIWDSPGGSNTLSYRKFNPDLNTISSVTNMTTNATFDKINLITVPVPYISTTSSYLLNDLDKCNMHWFIGHLPGSSERYFTGRLNTSTNVIDNYNSAINQLDLAVDFAGALSGLIPKGFAGGLHIDNPANYAGGEFFISIGTKIVKFNPNTNIYSILGGVAPGVINDIFLIRTGSAPNAYTLFGSIGTASNQDLYTIDQTTGVFTLSGPYQTNPGSFAWAQKSVSTGIDNSDYFWLNNPLKIEDIEPNYNDIKSFCDNYEIWHFNSLLVEMAGCFTCVIENPNYGHTVAGTCELYDQYDPLTYTNCRDCEDRLTLDCTIFIPCCSFNSGNIPTASGPMQLAAVTTATVGIGNTYSVSANGSTPECSIAVTPDNKMWLSFVDMLIDIPGWESMLGTCTMTNFQAVANYVPTNMADIAFDKHGNILITHGNNISWASATLGYESDVNLIATSWSVPLQMDTGYTQANEIVCADIVLGVASFRTYTNSLTGIIPVSVVTNNTISLGHDISVDYNTGDYWTLGDQTNSGGLDDLLVIDNANGNSSFISDLAIICSYAAAEHTYGIEVVRNTGGTTDIYVVSGEAIAGPNIAFRLTLRKLSATGTGQVGAILLINPSTGTTIWGGRPTGMAVNDICAKWKDGTDANNPALQQYTDCALCLADVSTASCCYMLTNCTTGAITYTNSNLSTSVGQTVSNASGDCFDVANSLVCVSPTPFTVISTFSDCTACQVPSVICYKLVNCGDATDIIYTTNVLTPIIAAYLNIVVQLTGENFCRIVQLDPSCMAPSVAVTIVTTAPKCNECNFYIQIQDCNNVLNNIFVSYAGSPTLVPFIGTADAHTLTVAGVTQSGCWKVIQMFGPTSAVYPNAVILTTSNTCTLCTNSGSCATLEHCCGTNYIANQDVSFTSGVVIGDVGQIIEAEVTVAGIVYPGCWTVVAQANCGNTIPDIDVTVLNSTTIGTPIGTDCTSCPTTPPPCPNTCELLVTCIPGAGPDITVSPGNAALVGTDAVTLLGNPNCYQVCPSGSPVHGTQMFFGDRLGIDYSSGINTPNIAGGSLMNDYNSIGATDYSTMGGATCSSNKLATIGGTTYNIGNIMFYTDGHLIYDSTHTLMLDSTGAAAGLLGGDPLATGGYEGRVFPQQGALYFPKTDGGSTNGLYHQWYVVCNTVKDGPIYYSIVDMTLNGGLGRVLVAGKNTILLANGEATEHMAVSNTTASNTDYYFYYRQKMSSEFDYNNMAIKAFKITNGVWGAAFVALDFPIGNGLNTWTDKQISTGELLISPNNRVLALGGIWAVSAGNDEGGMCTAWSINPATGIANGPGDPALLISNAYNGGGNNGVYQLLTALGSSYAGGSAPWDGWSEHYGSIAISQNSKYLFFATDGGAAQLSSSGQIWRFDINAWETGLPASPYSNFVTRGYPDDTMVNGWKYSQSDPVTMGDIALMPDGQIAFAMMNVVEEDLRKGKVGFAAPPQGNLSSCIGVIADPEGTAVNIASQIDGNGGMSPTGMIATVYNTQGRQMGNKFPTYLWDSCGCDPVNIQAINISNTYPDCLDAACVGNPTGQDGFKLTECVCTGGASASNPCDIANIANQPPAMVLNGKSWSPTCQAAGPERWEVIATAVANLATNANQTLTFTYSYMMPGGSTAQGPNTVLFETGPSTANPTGNNPNCTVYNKTYPITFASWQAEIAGIFVKIKGLIEGRFNTLCGYGADLIVNFVDVGYESQATNNVAGFPMVSNQANGTYTASDGTTGIGDFRFGMAATDLGCGGGGVRSATLAYAFNPGSNNQPGVSGAGVRNTSWQSSMIFDVNEDWRKGLGVPDPTIANSFDIQMVGAHELLHAFGLGHDIFWSAPCSDSSPGAGDGNCGCPCYQVKNYPNCMGLPCGVANPDALMGPWATINGFAVQFPTGLTGPDGIYEQRALCGIYGNPSSNYGCEDGLCLGCTYLTYYSTDFANLTAVAPGIIEWDDGTAAGLRCFEVEYINPMPAVFTDITPIVPINAVPGGDCTDCSIVPQQCWVLNLCPCNTITGAPSTIETQTDLSGYCAGTLGNGPVVEISAWPGACYVIDCTPITCTLSANAVVITNSYPDCTDCCVTNSLCYELCPCSSTPATDTCSAQTSISATLTFTSASIALNYCSIQANGLASTDLTTLKWSNPNNLSGCAAPQGGFYSKFNNPNAFHIQYQLNGNIPIGFQAAYTTWDSFLLDCTNLGITGITATTPYFGINVLLNTHFQVPIGDGDIVFMLGMASCVCTSGPGCITVTNDLSALIGQVVNLQPTAIPGLDDVTCYLPGVCGPCTQTPGSGCVPAGAVTVATVFADCQACDNVNPLDCYKLVDCSNPQNVIFNVCANIDIDTAFLNGEIVRINGGTICYEIQIDINCDPVTCNPVSVTNTYTSCATCNQSQMWECVGPCDCQPSAGAGWSTQALCLANLNPVTGLDCCPGNTYDCDAQCNCIPAGTTGQFATLTLCQTLVGASCCAGNPVTYDCGQFTPGSINYSCQDPGNGTGLFTGTTALADCNACVSSNCSHCYVESWNCVIAGGVATCVDPGDGSGTWNSSNGGVAACSGCNGCPLDPSCTGSLVTYDCSPLIGCYQVLGGTGAYADLVSCAIDCASYDPDGGEYEGDCINCFTDPNMQLLMENVADMCGDCNPPFGLEANEVVCDDCFGNSNIYVILDTTSTFNQGAGSTLMDKLQALATFKQNVIVPAFNQLQSEYPQYGGHLYILPGSWASISCGDFNGSGGNVPSNANTAENWLEWATYPLTGNAGANGPAPNPFTGGTLPSSKRSTYGSTMVTGIAGAPGSCGSYFLTTYNPILESILILPGSYSTDGFTQVNPWQDPLLKEGMSDPYHEFEGGDRDAVVMIFQDESDAGYYSSGWGSLTSNGFTNPIGSCGNPLFNNVPAVNWGGYGLGVGSVLTSEWKSNYTTFVEAHQRGIDINGVMNVGPAELANATIKTMVYAGSTRVPGPLPLDAHRDMFYHLYQAIGGAMGTVSNLGHVSCSDYISLPAIWAMQCYAVTDPTIPNMYMGASGGGDPTLLTGYKGGSLSEYGMNFFIPDYPVDAMNKDVLFNLWKEYLSDCV